MTVEDVVIDQRQQQLQQWLEPIIGSDVEPVAAGSDAGFRRYFRYPLAQRSLIAMDAPPETEDCRPFVKVAGLLREAGVSVPEIVAQDVEQGFLLLSDLGMQTCLEVMQGPGFKQPQADDLFQQAIDALIKFQASSQPDVLPNYDEALLRRELELFPEWYLQRHLALELNDELREILGRLFDQLIEQVLSQHKSYVHRDYMPRNLMPSVDNQSLGVIDFQDAVYGPISYDIASLFRDAFISWPEDKLQQWQRQYWQQAVDAGLPVPGDYDDFSRDCDYMACQRHIKVIGIFARICHRDGKPRYLDDVPRFFEYLNAVAKRRPELSALTELLAALGKLP